MRTNREYTLAMAWRECYRRAEASVFYLDPRAHRAVRAADRLLGELEGLGGCRSGPMRGSKTERVVLRHLRRRVRGRSDHDRKFALETASRLGVLAGAPARTRRGERVAMLEVERFFQGGNSGSGRHVRIGPLEIKGSGRNAMATRPDWYHSWGGLEFGKVVLELVYARLVDAIAPLGAVPCVGGLFLLHEGTPLAYVPDETARSYAGDVILLSALLRRTEYLRCGDVYEGPDRTVEPISDTLDACAIEAQYATLAGYGVYHMQPTLDNLTFEGAILDCGSLLVSRTRFAPPTREVEIPEGLGARSIVRKACAALQHCDQRACDYYAGGAMYVACSTILSTRRRVMGAHRGTCESAAWATLVGRGWFLREGFPAPVAAALGKAHGDLFAHHAHSGRYPMKRLVKEMGWSFGWTAELGGREVVHLQPRCGAVERRLGEVLEQHAGARDLDLARYNRHQLARASQVPTHVDRFAARVWTALREGRPVEWIENGVARMIMRSRPWCPSSHDARHGWAFERGARWRRITWNGSPDFALGPWAGEATHGHLLGTALGARGGRVRIPAVWGASGLDWRADDAPAGSYAIEGLRQTLSHGADRVIPLSTIMVRECRN